MEPRPISQSERGTAAPLSFRIVARSPISATAELLSMLSRIEHVSAVADELGDVPRYDERVVNKGRCIVSETCDMRLSVKGRAGHMKNG